MPTLRATPTAPRQPPALVVRNRMAAAGWVFMGIWVGMVVLFTWLMARDGPSPSQPAELQRGALALFWLIGLPIAAHAFAMPCTSLTVGADGAARLLRWAPLQRAEEVFPPGTIAAVRVQAGRDSDGDAYHRTVLVGADGREHLVGEGHHAPDQHALAARLRQALGLG